MTSKVELLQSNLDKMLVNIRVKIKNFEKTIAHLEAEKCELQKELIIKK